MVGREITQLFPKKEAKIGGGVAVADGEGTQIMLGDPFKFDSSNIAEWKAVY